MGVAKHARWPIRSGAETVLTNPAASSRFTRSFAKSTRQAKKVRKLVLFVFLFCPAQKRVYVVLAR